MVRVFFYLGDYVQAEAVAQEYLKQHQSLRFGVLDPYASTQIIKGDYQAAEDTIRQMLAQAQSPDAKPYMMQWVLNKQSFMAYRQGDYAQAIADAEKAFSLQIDDAARYDRAFYVSQSLNKFGQVKRAETLLLEEIERLNASPRVLELARLKSVLGESLTAQRRFAEAETILLEAYETQRSRVLPEQYDLVQTRQRLAELYRASGKADEAKKYE